MNAGKTSEKSKRSEYSVLKSKSHFKVRGSFVSLKLFSLKFNNISSTPLEGDSLKCEN